MPKHYNGSHLDLINQISQTLGNNPIASKYKNEDDLGYIVQVSEYLHSAEDNVDIVMDQAIEHKNDVPTASGMSLMFTDFTKEDTKILPQLLSYSENVIGTMLKDQELMEREPLLQTYLRYADLQFKFADLDPSESVAHFSDPATATANAIFSVFEHLPSSEEMERLRQSDPDAWEAGQAMNEYLKTYIECYQPDVTSKTVEEREAEKFRRRQNLLKATQALAEVGDEKCEKFIKATGNENQLNSFNFQTFRSPSHSPEKNVASLTAQLKMVGQGIAYDESQFLLEFSDIIKSIKSDLGGTGFKMENTLEPIHSELIKMDALADSCKAKFESGFSSDEEKHTFFQAIAPEVQGFIDKINAVNFDDLQNMEGLPEEEQIKKQTTNNFCLKMKPLADSKYSILGQALNMNARATALEGKKSYSKRIELNSLHASLGNTKGPKKGKEAQDFSDVMKELKTVVHLSKKKDLNDPEKKALGESYQNITEKSEAYLKDVLESKDLSPSRLENVRDRVSGTINLVGRVNPQKAEEMRQRASSLFEGELSWNEITQKSTTLRDKKPNYFSYYRLHCGDAVQNLPDKKLAEYTAKAGAAMMLMDMPRTKFDIDIARSQAKKLMASPEFNASIRAAGPEKVREVLSSGDMSKVAQLIAPALSHYQVNQEARNKLAAIAEQMPEKNRSSEWKKLKNVLADKNMRNSRQAFDCIEKYLKGKKSVSSNPVRQESVKLALDALAIVADNGDRITKERAQILVERFNKVRGVKPGHKDYIDLNNYGKNALYEQPEVKQNVIQQ